MKALDVVKMAIDQNRTLVGQIYPDSDSEVDDLMGAGMGELYSCQTRAGTARIYEVLGLDRYGQPSEEKAADTDAVLLDVYRHSGELWSVSGERSPDMFDTAKYAGVWIPDDLLRDQLDSAEQRGADRAKLRLVYCKQFLGMYNHAINGEIYYVTVTEVSSKGVEQLHESCGGLVGAEYAKETLLQMMDGCLPSLRATVPPPLTPQQVEPEGTIIIEVRGGVVSQVFCSRNMKVEIVDYDDLEAFDQKKDPYTDDYLRALATDEYRIY